MLIAPLLPLTHSHTDACIGRLFLAPGWLSPGNPDPEGKRVALVRQALDEHTYLEAIFWE